MTKRSVSPQAKSESNKRQREEQATDGTSHSNNQLAQASVKDLTKHGLMGIETKDPGTVNSIAKAAVRGYPTALNNIAAAIGVGQLKVVNDRVAARRANHDFYQNLLQAVPGISFLPEPKGYTSNRWLSCICINDRKTGKTVEEVRLHLEKDNIETRPLWKPMHLQPLFKNAQFYGDKVAQTLFDTGLCLPSGSNLTIEEKERITNQLKTVFSF